MALASWQGTITDESGNIQANATVTVLVEASGAVASIYSDRDGTTPLANPTTDEDGYIRFYAAGGSYRITATKGGFSRVFRHVAIGLLGEHDTVPGSSVSHEQIPAETSASITPTNLYGTTFPYDVRRVGIVPNNTAARAANTTALQALLDPTVTGPVGRFIFPNTTGADVYYFDDMVEIRDRVNIDLNGCTLNFSKTYESADNSMGFLTFIRNVIIENGSIVVDYDGSSGTNAGMAILVGSREGYPFGSATGGIFDADLTERMGNIILRNLDITTNNPHHAILMLGGLRNVLLENISIDGQDAATTGIYYEFGFATDQANNYERETSHAHNLQFRNIRITDISTSSSSNVGLGVTGAYQCSVDGLYVRGGQGGLAFSAGESLMYRPWVGEDDFDAYKYEARNIVCADMAGTAISIAGALDSTGYLSPLSLDPVDETDLIDVLVDNFVTYNCTSYGVLCSAGRVDIRNGSMIECQRGIVLTNECTHFSIEGCNIIDSDSFGIQTNLASSLFSPARHKIGSIRNCFIAGSGTAGASAAIVAGQCESIIIEGCRFGFESAHDDRTETTQTNAVNIQASARGVICRDNYVAATSGAAVAYAISGGPRGCYVIRPRGVATTSGTIGIDSVGGSFNATSISDDTHAVNTDDKYFGKMIYDSSNQRVLMALGSGATDGWRVIDGSATVTPD